MHPQVKGHESVTDRVGLDRLAIWMSRRFGAVLADLKSVDCGSVDVLLYCDDDLVVTTPGEMEADEPR